MREEYYIGNVFYSVEMHKPEQLKKYIFSVLQNNKKVKKAINYTILIPQLMLFFFLLLGILLFIIKVFNVPTIIMNTYYRLYYIMYNIVYT